MASAQNGAMHGGRPVYQGFKKPTAPRRKMKETKIKRPMNNYLIFATRRRKELHKKHPGKQTFQFSSAISKERHALTADEKEPYNREAAKMKEEHKKMYPDYKFQPKRKNKDMDRFIRRSHQMQPMSQFPVQYAPHQSNQVAMQGGLIHGGAGSLIPTNNQMVPHHQMSPSDQQMNDLLCIQQNAHRIQQMHIGQQQLQQAYQQQQQVADQMYWQQQAQQQAAQQQ